MEKTATMTMKITMINLKKIRFIPVISFHSVDEIVDVNSSLYR